MSSRATQRRKKQPGLFANPTIIAAISGGLLAAILGVVFIQNRKPGDGPEEPDPKPEKQIVDKQPAGKNAAPRKVETGLCRVYTKSPGFFVFVDGEPARDAQDNWLTTPCEVTVPRGTRDVTVAKAGFQDTGRSVNVEAEAQIDFGEIPTAAEGAASLLDAAYLKSPTAQPIPLFSLNTVGKSYDPSITPDGRTLYFVSDRGGTKRVYHATRPSAYHFFADRPQPIDVTRGADLPASPSLSADNLAVVYCLPDLGNVFAATRDLAVAGFQARKLLLPRVSASAKWQSLQVVREPGRAWRLYLLQKDAGNYKGYVAVAKKFSDRGSGFGSGETNALAPLAEQDFGEPAPFDLRGQPPVFSRDGLRMYLFNGRELRRAVRSNLDVPFPQPELIANLDLPDYQPTGVRRSFSLTDDEQWLFYESRGQLAMVRIFPGRSWGFIARGKSIPPLAPKVAVIPEKKQPTVDPKPKPPKVDPRTLPLPYPAFRAKLTELLKTRKYDDAEKHIAAGLADPNLAKDRDLVQWDAEDARQAAAYWKDADEAVAKMSPGMKFFVGTTQVEFVKYENGVITAKAGTSTFTTKTNELDAADAVAIVEKLLDRNDPKRQMRAGCLLYYDKKGNVKSAMTRFASAGDDGAAFIERLAQRPLRQARHEFDRDNIAQGLAIVNAVLKDHPKSKAAETAKAMIDEAYTRTKWTEVGPRKWTQKAGAFTAAPGRSGGSLLRSPQMVGNFELRLEWKSDVQNGQGGVYFRSNGGGDLSQTAFKIPLADDFGVRPDLVCTGALYKLQAPTENAVKPRGQWNTLILRVEGERVKAAINGRSVLDTVAKNEMIPLKGYVALDGTFGGITYRKTLLVELPDKP